MHTLQAAFSPYKRVSPGCISQSTRAIFSVRLRLLKLAAQAKYVMKMLNVKRKYVVLIL